MHVQREKKGEKVMKKHVTLTLILIIPCLVSFGQKSLFQAVIESNEASVKLLLAEGAEVDARDEIGKTPLIIAADKGYFPIVQLLIQNGADINAQHNLHWTALMFAAGKGHSAIVKLLVENGANINFVSKSDYTALILASAAGYAEIVDLLLENGAYTSPKKNDLTAQQWAEKLDQHNVLKVFEKYSQKP
jgi:ankyrin repeat protein